jgi:hypothetical protein
MCKLSEIESQALSTLVCSHFVCQNCGIIDLDFDRSRKGHICDTCNFVSKSGCLAFHIGFHTLVDLIQEAYHANSITSTNYKPSNSSVATILFYCTLREKLLNNFIEQHLYALKVPDSIIERLLDDNKLANQKFGELFTSTVGITWNAAIKHISKEADINFADISTQMKTAADLRNKFLHQGHPWSISKDFATSCVNSLGDLVNLFVKLHNTYTHPLVKNKLARRLG